MVLSMRLILHTSRRGKRAGLLGCFDADKSGTMDGSIDRSTDSEIRARTFRFGKVIDFATASRYEFNSRLGSANDPRRCSLATDRTVITGDIAALVSEKHFIRRITFLFVIERRT